MAEVMERDAVAAVLEDLFAPWVRQLGLVVEETGATGSRFTLPASAALTRGGLSGPPVTCGQALAAAADTVAVLSLFAAGGRVRDCTTVDLSIHFMRPVAGAATTLTAEILSNGRRMATVRVTGAAAGQAKPAISATLAFAWLED